MDMRRITFGLDYDGTFDLDKKFWHEFIVAAKAAGHIVYVVTARPLAVYGKADVVDAVDGACRIYFTDGKLKRPCMEKLGIKIDVWIDNRPEWIVGPLEVR